MSFGMTGFARKRLEIEEILRIVAECSTAFGELRFELFDADRVKVRRTGTWDKAKRLLSEGRMDAIAAVSVEDERNSVEIGLEGRDTCYLPYEVHVIREGSEPQGKAIERFFDDVVILSKCDYAFALFADNHMEVNAQLRFTPFAYWSAGHIEEDIQQRDYLLTLQHMRPCIGRRIPQIYPINYFSRAILANVETSLEGLIDTNDWDFTEIDGVTKIRFKDIFNRGRFKAIQEEIGGRMAH